jgi:predicted enzyme related to lactoylglutathione lyase
MTDVTELHLGEPCWVDLMSSDIERSRAFYVALFGWDSEAGGGEYGGYVTFSKDGKTVAGLGAQMSGSTFPDAWSVYFKSDDADATEAAAVAANATVLAPAMTIGDQGRMSVVADPSGAPFGIWQPAAMAGYQVTAELNAVVWHELRTLDFDAALPFYVGVLGWRPEVLSDSDEFRYSTFGKGGPTDNDPVGGVFDAKGSLPEGVPSHWTVFFGVVDVDASVASAIELGGTLLGEPQDSPYGRFAEVTDPTGASFVLNEVRAE